MKILHKLQSKRGHKEFDYLVSITPKQMDFLKKIISMVEKRSFKDGDKDYVLLVELRRFFNKI